MRNVFSRLDKIWLVGRCLILLAALVMAIWIATSASHAAGAPGAGIDAFKAQPATFVQASSSTTPSFLPCPSLKTAFVLLHLVGVTLGFGAALFLDLYMLQFLHHRATSQPVLELVRFGERLVTIGLVALWVSGLAFLVIYYFQSPASLGNPKLWTKIGIVCLLTINGLVIHRVITPRMIATMGRPMLAGADLPSALPVLAVGAISAVSWASAFTLGIVKEFNAVVPGMTLAELYVALLACMLAAACIFHLTLTNRSGQRFPLNTRAQRVTRIRRVFTA